MKMLVTVDSILEGDPCDDWDREALTIMFKQLGKKSFTIKEMFKEHDVYNPTGAIVDTERKLWVLTQGARMNAATLDHIRKYVVGKFLTKIKRSSENLKKILSWTKSRTLSNVAKLNSLNDHKSANENWHDSIQRFPLSRGIS